MQPARNSAPAATSVTHRVRRAGSPLVRVALRTLLTLSVFVLVLFGRSTGAAAAPIGMCSEDAQSIVAPPPLLWRETAQLRGCDASSENGITLGQVHDPTHGIVAPDLSQDRNMVLTAEIVPLPASVSRLPVFVPEKVHSEEHRRRGLRPPCF